MTLDLEHLRAVIAAHGPVIRVMVRGVRGSAPREAGAQMLVWPGGQDGSIGGGALEWRATQMARDMLGRGAGAHAATWPLGPDLGQCCGGAVDLLWERFDAAPGALPYTRDVAGHEVTDHPPGDPPLWIWGAGHVGRALVASVGQILPITWVDLADACFPANAERTTCIPTADPVRLCAHTPPNARHVIVTRDHDLDLSLCDALLRRGTAGIGLIGSDTKWARFQTRLRAMGHRDLSPIQCPIGDRMLGRHPQAIALGVGVALLKGTFGGRHDS